MATIGQIILLLGAATAGYYFFRLCRIPLAAFIGPMVFGGLLNYFYLYPDISLFIPSFLCKLAIGMSLGSRFNRSMLGRLRDLPVPAVLTAVWMMAASLICGYVLYYCSDLSLKTALISSSAGGIAEMTIFAMALGADVVTVVFVQFFRLIVSMLSFPLLIKFRAMRRQNGETACKAPSLPEAGAMGPFTPILYIFALIAAFAGGGAGEYFHIPAGAMLGSMLGTAVVVIFSGRSLYLPPKMNMTALFFLGTIVAQDMTHDTLAALGGLVLPLFFPTLLLLVLCFLLSWLLTKMTDWSDITCLLASMPAGLVMIAPLAEECRADVLKVSLLHTVRMISIVVFLPWIIRALVQ